MNQEASEHAHHEHGIPVVINGQQKTAPSEVLTYEQVVDLAFDGHPPTGENILIVVTYRRAPGEGYKTLVAGGKVEIKKGEMFNVTPTDKS